jgi:hypothetical protein
MKRILSVIGLILTCALALGASVTLQWDLNAPGDGITAYKVYEVIGTNYVLQATVPGTIDTATIAGVVPGLHTYVATASNVWGESTWSNPASTPTGPTPPGSVRVTVVVTVE